MGMSLQPAQVVRRWPTLFVILAVGMACGGKFGAGQFVRLSEPAPQVYLLTTRCAKGKAFGFLPIHGSTAQGATRQRSGRSHVHTFSARTGEEFKSRWKVSGCSIRTIWGWILQAWMHCRKNWNCWSCPIRLAFCTNRSGSR